MYKYFCSNCGIYFTSDTPERDSFGLLNDVHCPNCGGFDVYTDNASGHAAELKHSEEHEERAALWIDN